MNETRPLSVLFLSTGNAARSILAEALLRHKGGIRFRARSGGVRPLPELHAMTLATLKAEGIPTDGLHAKGWREFLASVNILPVDVIVTLSEEAKETCAIWPAPTVRVHWPVDDPLSAPKADVMEWKFRKCFSTLENRITALVKTKIVPTPDQLLMQFKDLAMVV
jgi:arsenate reductase